MEMIDREYIEAKGGQFGTQAFKCTVQDDENKYWVYVLETGLTVSEVAMKQEWGKYRMTIPRIDRNKKKDLHNFVINRLKEN